MKLFDKLTTFLKDNKDVTTIEYETRLRSLKIYRNELKNENTFAVGFSADDSVDSDISE